MAKVLTVIDFEPANETGTRLTLNPDIITAVQSSRLPIQKSGLDLYPTTVHFMGSGMHCILVSKEDLTMLEGAVGLFFDEFSE